MHIDDPSLVHCFGCGVLLFDRRGGVTFANEPARRLLGLTDRDLLQTAQPHPWRMLAADGQPLTAAEHPFSRILRGERMVGEEFRLECRDGSTLTVAMNGAPLVGPGGETTGGVVDFNDITEKSRAQAAVRQAMERLAASESRLRALVGSIDEIVFEFDADGIYLNVWTGNEELLKRPREELLGRPVTEVVGEELGAQFLERLRRVQRTGVPETFDYPLQVLGGARWFLARVAPIPPADDAPVTLAFLARDITDRKQMEEVLRASERRFHQILENIQLAALMLDRQGRVTFCNDFLLRLTGRSREELLGRDWFDSCIPPEDRRQLRDFWRQTIKSRATSRYHESPILTVSGEHRLLAWNVIVQRGAEGRALFCASIGQDITERQRAEEVLRRSDEMKSEFISIAAHELRTPLTSILGYAEILLNQAHFGEFTAEQQRSFLQEIYDKGLVLAETVNELLDLSRIESGQSIPLQLAPCSLDEILSSLVASYRRNFPRHRFELQLEQHCPAGILVDRRKMEQVMENLMSNAVRYSPADSLVRIVGRQEKGGYRVTVIDQGIGMKPEQVARIFEKFYRADFSDTSTGGLGLGMSIVKGIIEAHGGWIHVESAPGQGTSVSFFLPEEGSGERKRETSRNSIQL